MNQLHGKIILCLALGFGVMLPATTLSVRAGDAPKIKALIIDGQNNHNWRATTPILKAALESSGLFTVDVVTTHPERESIADFKPDFEKYKVIVSNFNGADWPIETQHAFEEYMKNGGGFVSVHAADN